MADYVLNYTGDQVNHLLDYVDSIGASAMQVTDAALFVRQFHDITPDQIMYTSNYVLENENTFDNVVLWVMGVSHTAQEVNKAVTYYNGLTVTNTDVNKAVTYYNGLTVTNTDVNKAVTYSLQIFDQDYNIKLCKTPITLGTVNNIIIGENNRGFGLSNGLNNIVCGHNNEISYSSSNDSGITIGNNGGTSNVGISFFYYDNNVQKHVFVGKGGTSWQFGSDKRIKKNIEPADTSRCLDGINNLPVKRFEFEDYAGGYSDVHQTGFIAQDMEKVFPKFVHTETRDFKDIDGNVIKHFDDFKSIEREPLIPVLCGAVQELTKQIEDLKRQIEDLKK